MELWSVAIDAVIRSFRTYVLVGLETILRRLRAALSEKRVVPSIDIDYIIVLTISCKLINT